mgnify:CR=1 FL=1
MKRNIHDTKDNKKKWSEVYYKRDDNPEVITKTKLDEGLNIEWMSEYYNDEFEKTGQNLFITGKCEDIYKWIDKQNINIPKPKKITVDVPNNHLKYAITWYAISISIIFYYHYYEEIHQKVLYLLKNLR